MKSNEVLKVEDLQRSFQNVEEVIEKKYLDNISTSPILKSTKEITPAQNIRLRKVTKIVFDKNENIKDKLTSVYSTINSLGGSALMVIHSNGNEVELYLGTKKTNDTNLSLLQNGYFGSLAGNFPGCKIEERFLNSQIEELMNEKIFNSDIPMAVSMANGVPALKNDNEESFSQGIEKFIEAMNGKKYSAVFIADHISESAISERRAAYEKISSTLLPFASQQITFGRNESTAITEGISSSFTNTVTESLTKTQSQTEGTSTSYSETKNTNGEILGAKKGYEDNGVKGAIAGFVLGSFISNSETTQTGENNSFTQGESQQSGTSESTMEGTNNSESKTTGQSETYQINYENKTAKNILDKIDKQIERIIESENYGMFDFAAYFISDSYEDAKIAASTYKAITRGEESSLERSSVVSWNIKESVQLIPYLKNFEHPKVSLENLNMDIMPTSLISSRELALAMNLPRKSVKGIAVQESVEFGRSLHFLDNTISKRTINLGKLTHLGNAEENTDIKLDIDSLGMHTLVTGSTGAGKSNTLYTMLDQLNNNGVNFLVVEPAKGEYKEIFGGREDVTVFGTNSKYSMLLRLNPFSFHDEIHVLEHIDRLVEIFNACWPMYAAMPEVLKDAIIKSYEETGWDTDISESIYETKRYPTFKILLNTLEKIIDDSSYSEEMKSNYKGALLTRVKSLNNGLIGQVLNNVESVSDNELFDANVIIDLSRVGSMETKSLLMGMIVLRLIEYRYSNKETSNSTLKHVTVLEEAHNILKRTSTEQSSEGSNLQGKSVEMISNAIAEMRTYGEGFIIVDQSPNMLDISAIRNTGTKIIMRLPEYTDRNDIGKSAALNDEQISEIPKLATGTAVVYQNNWLEAVLCQINIFDKNKFKPLDYSFEDVVNTEKHLLADLLKILLYEELEDNLKTEVDNMNLEAVKEYLKIMNVSNPTKDKIIEVIKNQKATKEINKETKAMIVNEILEGSKILSRIKSAKNMEEYDSNFSQLINKTIDTGDSIHFELLVKDLVMYNESCNTTGFDKHYDAWCKSHF